MKEGVTRIEDQIGVGKGEEYVNIHIHIGSPLMGQFDHRPEGRYFDGMLMLEKSVVGPDSEHPNEAINILAIREIDID